MLQDNYSAIILEQTQRALWEVKNVIDCIPDKLWDKPYCNSPLWKHVYHMLHSLDTWFINPNDSSYEPPYFDEPELSNIDAVSQKKLSRDEILQYFEAVNRKISDYCEILQDNSLLTFPEGCDYTRFTLVLAQFRHLHTHMGMIMGFIVDDVGLWPRNLGLTNPIPTGEYDKYC